MYISPIFIAGLCLVGVKGVFGGSRFWEEKAPNKRTNPSPNYLNMETLNETSSILKRAYSIRSQPSDDRAARIWPDKKVRYCFDDPNNVVVKGLWDSAKRSWAQLERHGFKYEEVSNSVCTSQRSSVLRIYYNQNGRLSATLGIPVLDPNDTSYVGPSMHLSDMEGVGQDNVAANVAHELGHVWGLAHEHQNPEYWEADLMDGWNIPIIQGNVKPKEFMASSFNCKNLRDYGDTVAKLQTKINAATGIEREDFETVIIMTYKDGSLIPNRLVPSDMDLDRLVTLYGTPAPSTLQVPHNSQSSGFTNTLRKVRSKIDFKRAGDTAAGLC